MGFKPITRNMPAEEPPNILSEDDAAIYRGILGQDGVLNIGSKLKSTVLSNNKVRVGDGVINVDGHIGRNAYADYEDLTIENGTAGQKRNDLIIASFSTTGSGGLDTYVLKVKKGVAGSTGTDPAVTKQDIYAGGKLREYPLYRVKLDGLSIVGVEQLFKVIPTVPELETKYNELNSAYLKLMQSDGLPGAAMKFYKAENLTYGCFATGCYIYPGYSTENGAPDNWGGLLIVYKTPESYVKYALTRGGAIFHMINKSDGQVEQSWTKLCGKY